MHKSTSVLFIFLWHCIWIFQFDSNTRYKTVFAQLYYARFLDSWIRECALVFGEHLGVYWMYPLIYRVFFSKYQYKTYWLLAALMGIGMICYMGYAYLPHLHIFIFRIPIFLIGCFFGKKVYENQSLRLMHILILIAISIVTYVLFKQFSSLAFLRNLFYIPLSIMIVLALSFIYRLNQRYLKLLNIPIVFLGGYTLEIYLTHEKVQENLWRILSRLGFEVTFNHTIYQLSCIGISIALSIIISRLLKRVQNRFQYGML